MTEKNDGGPAFPRTQWTGSEKNAAHRDVAGLSMRDWFAGQALAGILPATDNESGRSAFTETEPSWIAQKAYELADAMLEARKK